MSSPAMKRILESEWYNAVTHETGIASKQMKEWLESDWCAAPNPPSPPPFPQVVRYGGEYHVVGSAEKLTLEQVLQLDNLGILKRWDDGALFKDI